MMMYMVRKQLYLTEEQDASLKRQAAEAGVSEAEIVRRALDAALRGTPPGPWRPGRAEAVAQLLATWDAGGSVLPEAFDREALYDDRLNDGAARR